MRERISIISVCTLDQIIIIIIIIIIIMMYTVKPLKSGHSGIRTPLKSGHFS